MKTPNRNDYINQIVGSLRQEHERLQLFCSDDYQKQKKGFTIKFQLSKHNIDSHYEMLIVYITWINMWCGTFKDQDDQE